MPNRERLRHLGTRRGERLLREFAESVREARHGAGLSQLEVAGAIGLSKSSISRIETGNRGVLDIMVAARLARVVGLDLALTCYPAAGPLRDEAHVKLLNRFNARLHRGIARRAEAPVRQLDQRAWDLLLTVEDQHIGVAAETRIRDLQALLRRELRKLEDGALDRLILLVADTYANRRALSEGGAVLQSALPLGTRQILASLGSGRAPTGSGVVVL